MELRSITVRRSYLFLPILFTLITITLLLRITDIGSVAGGLTGDDGGFLNQAYERGMQSLWTSAGYQLLYHKVIALLARNLPLEVIPYIFFAAWLAPFLCMVYLLISRGEVAGLDRPRILFLVFVVSLQPSYFESFFFFSSSHFFLGAALLLHACIPSGKPESIQSIIFLIFSSLSGPFSAFATPILAIQLLLFRDFSSRRATYTIVPTCGLVQLACILLDPRIDSTVISGSITYWLHAISSLVFFGSSDKLTCVAGTLFWSLTLLLLLRPTERHGFRLDLIALLPLLSLVVVSIGLYFVSALMFSVPPLVPNPLGFGSRYFIIPYSLAFYVAIVCTRESRSAQISIVFLVSIICGATFRTVSVTDRPSTAGPYERANFQWLAYAKFQRVRPNLVIPVNPPWPIYPPLHNVHLNKIDEIGNGRKGTSALILVASSDDSSTVERNNSMNNVSSAGIPQYFDITTRCTASRYLALEIDAWRSNMGWARISWGSPGDFSTKRSMERFYPAGPTVMQFAFRRNTSEYIIRFDPAEGVPESEAVLMIHSPVNDNFRRLLATQGAITGHATDPGGEVRINEVRLFCLD